MLYNCISGMKIWIVAFRRCFCGNNASVIHCTMVMNSVEVTSFYCTDYHFLGKNCLLFFIVTRRPFPKYINCSFHIVIYCITCILYATRTTSRKDIQILWWYNLNIWICALYTHMCMKRTHLKNKGGAIDAW